MELTPHSPTNTPTWWMNLKIGLYRGALVFKRLWWIPLLTVSLGLAGAAWFISQTPPSYLSAGRMMVSGKINITEGNAYTEELLNFFGTQIELMQSGEVQNRAYAHVQAYHPELPLSKVKLTVGQQPKASLFILKAIAPDGVFAQKYLDACMAAYMSVKKEMRSAKSESTAEGLGEELARTEKELREGEQELLTFQQKNNIGYLREEGNSAATYLAGLNRQLADLKKEFHLLERLDVEQNLDRTTQGVTTADGTAQSATFAMAGPAADYSRARQQLRILQVERKQMSEFMRPQHPDIVALDQQIARAQGLLDSLREQTVDQLKSRRAALAIQIESLEGMIQDWEEKAVDLSRRIGEFNKIQSKVDRIKGQYDRLFASLRTVDVTRTVDQDMVSILEKASPPKSVKPGLPAAIAVGVLGGLLLGLGILFAIDRIDDRVTTLLAVQHRFQEPILGQILNEQHNGPLQLLQPDDARHGFFEAFRNLRSSLMYLAVEGERPRAFLVTSAVPNEGKSTVSSNLAIVLALSGARTLLIDGDLRRGAAHRAFGLENEVGFSEVLKNEIRWPEAVLQTGIDNLFLLPRGRSISHPGERLLSPITDKFLKEVYARYEYVVFDSAPVLVADDTSSIAPKIDAVLFVVRFNQSSLRLGHRAVELLKQRQANVLGLVLNGLSADMPEYGYYEYSDYYRPVGEEENLVKAESGKRKGQG